MKVNVGSKNPTKIQSVIEALQESPLFKDAEVIGLDVSFETFGHPRNIAETVAGAQKRAELAFKDCDYSFGIEGGLIEIPETKSHYMQVEVCAIYDGKQFHLGLSPAFEWPPVVTKLIFDGLDGSQALKQAGFTDLEKVGNAGGGISILTKGKMDRTEFNRLSIVMALVHLENPDHY